MLRWHSARPRRWALKAVTGQQLHCTYPTDSFDTRHVRGDEYLTAIGNERQPVESVRRGRTEELLTLRAAATLTISSQQLAAAPDDWESNSLIVGAWTCCARLAWLSARMSSHSPHSLMGPSTWGVPPAKLQCLDQQFLCFLEEKTPMRFHADTG